MNDSSAEPRAYVLGGNASTLAFVSSLVPENRQVTAWLVPLAWTPIGVAIGETWQRVNIAADNVPGWADQTFSPDDERSFVTSMHDLEMLLRIAWKAPAPTELSDKVVINPEDLPEDVLDGLAHPAEMLAQCAVCRRTCVRDHFVWNERRLCAWDYHSSVFGKRGPWRAEPYEERHFETLPQAKYVAGGLLEEVAVDAVLAIDGVDDALARRLIGEVMANDRGPHLAVRTDGGYTLLRERAGTGEPS
ncbi:MAG: hypothetical protein ABR591_11165 [Candidatus Velthaea sp.]